ncbi:MAG TPA: hypothetical protein V6D33_18495 [Cyanophyceae cyanobacterium]
MPKDGKKQPKSSDKQTQPTVTSTRKPKPSFLNVQVIKVLRGTIGLLEKAVDTLEREPVKELPATASEAELAESEFAFDTPVAKPEAELVVETTTVISESEFIVETTTVQPEPESISDTPVVTPEPASIPDIPVVTPKPESTPSVARPVTSELIPDNPAVAPEPVEALKPTPSKLTERSPSTISRPQPLWTSFLAKIRSVLPQAVNEKLSDWVLTGAIAGTIVALVFAATTLLSQPQTPPQVAEAPAQAPETTIKTPPQLKAPKPEQTVEFAPPPEPELTPEQSLIAGIQEQVAEITNQFGSGLIQSIDANFLGSRLIVKVSNDWYTLKEVKQNQLADDMLRRANELDFSKLEITDLEGTLIARSPVVGSHMVILKRQELAAN